MVSFFWLLVVLVLVTAFPEPINTADSSLGRIYLGRNTVHGEFEYVARIQERIPSSHWFYPKYQYCSGVIIHAQWVLTSDPCGTADANSTQKLWVYPKCNDTAQPSVGNSKYIFGLDKLSKPMPTLSIYVAGEVKCSNGVDPIYVTVDKVYDVDQPAGMWHQRILKLIKLDRPLLKVGIVAKLATNATDPYERIKEIKGFRIRIAGYGATQQYSNNKDDHVKKLKMAYMLVRNQTECILPGTPGWDKYFICLEGGYDGTNSCFADTGGPMVYQDLIEKGPVVIGIMNDYGAGCYQNPINMGQVFGTRVGPFRDRIQQIMGSDMLL